jgi:hypothetical protein
MYPPVQVSSSAIFEVGRNMLIIRAARMARRAKGKG